MSKKVLIIEDDEAFGDSMLQRLKNAGYDTTLARDGGEGLKKITDILPDLVLLDIVLPSMSGYEILEAKIKNDHIKNIPVIVISNSGDPTGINRALSLGVKDYLIKSQCTAEEIIAKVAMQLGSAGDATGSQGQNVTQNDGLGGRKILWVEDDKFLSDIIARKLSNQNCNLIHAITGEEALAHIEEDMPDIVMLDLLLPGMNGFQVLQKIKSNPKTKHIPVILLSNLGQQSDVEKGETLGAAKFLIKATVTLDEIVKEIKKTIPA